MKYHLLATCLLLMLRYGCATLSSASAAINVTRTTPEIVSSGVDANLSTTAHGPANVSDGGLIPSTVAVTTSTQQPDISTDQASLTGEPITTDVHQLNTTTATPVNLGPWKTLSFALVGVSVLLLIGLSTVIIVLCKMRTKLRQASKTLYPMTPGQGGNEYYDLEHADNVDIKGGKVELKHMTVHHEEEFDSPLHNPPTPPVPLRKAAPPPPPGISKVPSRSKLKHQEKHLVTEMLRDGAINPGFVDEDDAVPNNTRRVSQKSVVSNISVYTEEDEAGELYESYDPNTVAQAMGRVPITQEYEEPVKPAPGKPANADRFINRQGSSSGLPESPLPNVSSKERLSMAPLQDNIDEADDFENFDAVDPDTGLPNLAGMGGLDEDEFFDDPEKMTAQETDDRHKDDTDDEEDDSLEDVQLDYDDADMVIADDLALDEEEPGFYEDFHTSNRIEQGTDIIPSPGEQDATANKSRSTTGASAVSNEDSDLPIVPPRRDMKRKQFENDNIGKNLKNMDLPGLKDQKTDDLEGENEVQLRRPGRQVSAQGQSGPRDSYFLFMDDKTKMINEPGPEKIDLDDDYFDELSGKLAGNNDEMMFQPDLNINIHSDDNALFDMHPEAPSSWEEDKHVNGGVPKTDHTDRDNEWVISDEDQY